jgi:hypothetical protein
VHQPREITKPYYSTVECAHRNGLETQSSLLYILATRLHQSQNVKRDKVHGVYVGGVGKTMSNFFFTSHLIAAAVKYRPYREVGERVEL